MRGLPSGHRVFGGRAKLIASLPLLAFIKNVYLGNPPLYPAYAVGGSTPCLTCQGTVGASTRGGADASLLAQHMDKRLDLAYSLRTAARVRLGAIPSTDEALWNFVKFNFVTLNLFSAGRRNSPAVTELLGLIERLEEIHTKAQGIISSHHLARTILYNVSQRWSLYLKRCVPTLATKSL